MRHRLASHEVGAWYAEIKTDTVFVTMKRKEPENDIFMLGQQRLDANIQRGAYGSSRSGLC
jgi:hypothetical protein